MAVPPGPVADPLDDQLHVARRDRVEQHRGEQARAGRAGDIGAAHDRDVDAAAARPAART